MRNKIKLFSALILLILCSFSCAPSWNTIIVDKDVYKNQETIKLKQNLKGYSNEKVYYGIGNRFDYMVTVKYSHFKNYGSNRETKLEITMRTPVNAYELKPELFLNFDGEIMKLNSSAYNTKNYIHTSTSTSSSTTAENKDKKDGEKEKETKVTTTHTSNTSNDTYQLMQHEFILTEDIVNKIKIGSLQSFRIYLGEEGIDLRFTYDQKRTFKEFFGKI